METPASQSEPIWSPSHSSLTRTALMTLALLMALARAEAATSYTFIGFNAPLAQVVSTRITGVDYASGTLVGSYTDVYGNTHGWRGNRTAATQVLLQPIQGITRQKWTVGSFRPALAPSGERQGFLLKGTAMTPITMAGCLEVEPHAVNEAGEVVGSCGGGDAWHWKDGVVTFLAPPDDPIDNCEGFGFEATGINKAGVIVGSCADSGFINNHGVVTVLEVWLENGSPGYTYPKGINDKGTIFGTACDVDNPCYGLLIKQGVTSFVSYPGAPHTEITAVHPTNGRIWGNWQDSAGVWHAFTATPGTAPALMSEEVATR